MSTIYQKNDFIKTVLNTDLSKAFNKGINNNGSFPVLANRDYEFSAKLIISEFGLTYNTLYFGMLGDVQNVGNIKYTSLCFPEINEINENLVFGNFIDFNKKAVNNQVANERIILQLDGTFSCFSNGYLQPAIAFNASGFDVFVESSSFFKVTEIETTNDIL